MAKPNIMETIVHNLFSGVSAPTIDKLISYVPAEKACMFLDSYLKDNKLKTKPFANLDDCDVYNSRCINNAFYYAIVQIDEEYTEEIITDMFNDAYMIALHALHSIRPEIHHKRYKQVAKRGERSPMMGEMVLAMSMRLMKSSSPESMKTQMLIKLIEDDLSDEALACLQFFKSGPVFDPAETHMELLKCATKKPNYNLTAKGEKAFVGFRRSFEYGKKEDRQSLNLTLKEIKKQRQSDRSRAQIRSQDVIHESIFRNPHDEEMWADTLNKLLQDKDKTLAGDMSNIILGAIYYCDKYWKIHKIIDKNTSANKIIQFFMNRCGITLGAQEKTIVNAINELRKGNKELNYIKEFDDLEYDIEQAIKPHSRK